jgi:parvulin-like peptidyl-prolyl isomerase
VTGWVLWGVLAAWPFASEVGDERVVARAVGPAGPIEITAGRLRRYAEQHPSRSPRALAAELIDFELLAAEATRRGLGQDPQVQAEARPALVTRYLKTHFEGAWTADTMPEALVADSYERNRGFFVHPELVTVDHIVLTQERAFPKDPALVAQGEALMAALRQSLVADPPADAEAFVARAKAFEAQATPLGLEVRGERLGRFAQKSNFDPAFTAKVFELSQPGELSAVFVTKFGWHIARLELREAAQNRTLADASGELRARIVPEVRELKLRELTESLIKSHGVEIDFEPIRLQSVE